MKKIPKHMYEEIISLSRMYWKNGEEEILTERIHLAQKLEKIIGVDWLSILDFVDSIVRNRGFFHDAKNIEIYCALEMFGWEVMEDV